MSDDSAPNFLFPAICRKKVTAAFDGGRLTSDGGVLLLAQAERRIGLATTLAGCIADRRDQSRVIHDLDDILRARMRRTRVAITMPAISMGCGTIRGSAGAGQAARGSGRACHSANHLALGECANDTRTCAADGHGDRHLLGELSRAASGGHTRHR